MASKACDEIDGFILFCLSYNCFSVRTIDKGVYN